MKDIKAVRFTRLYQQAMLASMALYRSTSIMRTSEFVQPTEPAARRALPSGMITMLALGTTIILWASAFVGIRAALPAYGPLHLAVLRFLVAIVVLAVAAFILRVRLPERRDLPRIVLCGLLG